MDDRRSLALSNASCLQLAAINTLVSSANRLNFALFETLHMSFIYRRNSKGPNTDPWGTPNSTRRCSEFSFSTFTY